MKRIAFIIPYFGSFNNYFNLFLQSCEKNKDLCDWIIFTDDKKKYNYPSNVYVHYCKWTDLVDYIQSKFDVEISLDRPYKLCDFKPMYGYIFENYLKEYDFWGYCDTDLIWGKISHFLNDSILNEYDKIFNLGHCTIFKNSFDNIHSFELDFNGQERYLQVITNSENESFDEEYGRKSINDIFVYHKLKLFEESFAANIYMKSSNFRLTSMNKNHTSYIVERIKKNFFVVNNNGLYRYVIGKNNNFSVDEFMYIHMQSRKMKNLLPNNFTGEYKIIPNSMEPIEISSSSINFYNIRQIKTKHFNLHYFRLRSHNLADKIMKRWRSK